MKTVRKILTERKMIKFNANEADHEGVRIIYKDIS